MQDLVPGCAGSLEGLANASTHILVILFKNLSPKNRRDTRNLEDGKQDFYPWKKKKKKGRAEILRSRQLSIKLQKVPEQLINEFLSIWNKEMSNNQYGFVTNKSCQTNLISSCSRAAGLARGGEAADVICLRSGKGSD